VTPAALLDSTVDPGRLMAKVAINPDYLEKLREQGEDEPDEQPPFPFGMLPGPGDRYIITEGPAKGMKGYFARNTDGDVEAVHVGGRLATKTAKVPEPA